MCRDGGPKSIGSKNYAIQCQVGKSTGYLEERLKKIRKKKKNRVGKVILKSRLPLIADSQSCLRFACSPQEHQWGGEKILKCLLINKKRKKQRRREGLKPVHQFQQSHSLFTRLGTITKHNFVCERKNLDQLRVVIFSSCVTINYTLISMYSAIHMYVYVCGPGSGWPLSHFVSVVFALLVKSTKLSISQNFAMAC